MKEATMLAISAILSADSSCPEEHQKKIIRFCKGINKPSRNMGTVKDAARILQCHVKTVHKYAARGLLHPTRITKRKIRYDLDEVMNLLTGEAV